jgi:hypothetical protein
VKRVIALFTVASALLLAGCSQVGAAATVGSTKITQASVQKSIDGILAERAKVSTAGMTLATGADEKITVTKAEIDTRRATIITQLGGEANLPKALVGANIASADFPEYLQLILQSEKVAQFAVASGVAQADSGTAIQKLVVAKAAKLKVTVNPQYGKWDATTGDVVAADAASPAASPAATK